MKTKNNVTMRLLPSIICLLPIFFSLAVYNRLPEQIAIHWDMAGNPNNFAPKGIAAFGLPFLFCIITFFVQAKLYTDPKRDHGSRVMRLFSIWITPVISLILVPMTLLIALGAEISVPFWVLLLLGIILIICGNYMPKSRQNYTIGIKLPWTLASVENWNKTHRVAGYLWILGGICLVVAAFLSTSSNGEAAAGGIPFSLVVVAVIVVVPTVYSYWLFRQEDADQDRDE